MRALILTNYEQQPAFEYADKYRKQHTANGIHCWIGDDKGYKAPLFIECKQNDNCQEFKINKEVVFWGAFVTEKGNFEKI